MSNEIHLFGTIGRTQDGSGITAQQVKTALANADQNEPLIVRIDSEGGSVFDGFSIYEAFANYPGPKKAIIESTAFSIASYIAMAFDEIEIAENGYIMVHQPYTMIEGTADDLEKNAELLAKLDQSMVDAYSKKTGLSPEETRMLMKEETFLNASESLNYGFVTAVSDRSVQTSITPQARHNKLPQRVFAALFGAGSSGEQRETTKEKPMSESQPVAATLEEIEAAFPKAKADFVVKCLKKKMPMASVASAAAEELLSENEELKAKLAAMEEEMAKLRAESEEEPEAMEDEDEHSAEYDEEKHEAKAKARKAIRPVARVRRVTTAVSATARWDEAVKSCLNKCGGNKVRAAFLANRENPGLREEMLSEANSR